MIMSDKKARNVVHVGLYSSYIYMGRNRTWAKMASYLKVHWSGDLANILVHAASYIKRSLFKAQHKKVAK